MANNRKVHIRKDFPCLFPIYIKSDFVKISFRCGMCCNCLKMYSNSKFQDFSYVKKTN